MSGFNITHISNDKIAVVSAEKQFNTQMFSEKPQTEWKGVTLSTVSGLTREEIGNLSDFVITLTNSSDTPMDIRIRFYYPSGGGYITVFEKMSAVPAWKNALITSETYGEGVENLPLYTIPALKTPIQDLQIQYKTSKSEGNCVCVISMRP